MSVRRQVLVLLALGAAIQLVFIGLRVTAILQAVTLGVSPATIGLLQASFSAVAIASLQFGRLTDRFGARPTMLWSVGAVLAASLLLGALPVLPAAALAGLAAGAGNSAFYVAQLKLLGELSTPANRLAYMSASSVCYSVANSCGPLLAGAIIDGAGHHAAYLATLPVAVAAFALAYARVPPSSPAPPRAGVALARGALQLLADRRTGTIYLASGIVTVALESFNFLAPIYASGLGFSATAIGALLSTAALAMLAVRAAAPLLARRVAPFRLMLAALVAISACYIAFPLSTALPVLLLLAFLTGMAFGIVNPIGQTLLYELSPPGRSGEVLGLRQVLVGCGHAGVPIAFGAVSAALGILPVFWGIAVLGLAGCGVAQRRWTGHTRTTGDSQ